MSDTEERPAIPMELDLRVDILDNEGIWNTGQIVDMSRDEEDMVEIKYDGWGDEYNEWIPLSSQRLAPLHMFTMVKKCWAKLTKWPWWPAFVVLRAPTRKSAADALNAESKIYVEFFDSYNEGKRSRCWMQKKNIASFQEGFDERASKNIGKNFPAYVEGTQRAIAGGSPVLFSGNGTLPIEFSSRYAEPLAARKLALAGGDEDKWFEAYRIFSNRYRVLYGYDFAKDSTSTLLGAAKRAKGKRANGAKEAEVEEEDDDDEVEIIATVPPAKRGRGRPPKGKHPKKQPKYFADEEDENEDDGAEEKDAGDDDEYQDAAEDAEDDDEDDADEEPESPRGRRSARTAKRKPVAEEEPRRNMRPRRAKDGEDGDEDDEDDIGEDFSHYEYYDDVEEEGDETQSHNGGRRSTSRSASPEMRAPRTKFQSKTHKRSALTQLMASSQPQPVLQEPASPPTRPRRSLLSQSLMDELEAAVTGSPSSRRDTSVESSPRSTSKPRRKSANPQSLSSSLKTPGGRREPTDPAGSPGAKDELLSLRHWLGFGAADEGIPHSGGAARKPWSIQNWLLNGFRRKQTSDCLTNED